MERFDQQITALPASTYPLERGALNKGSCAAAPHVSLSMMDMRIMRDVALPILRKHGVHATSL
jgi:hypothetical protein